MLKAAHVLELLDVQPEAHARAQKLQLPHERVRLILPGSPRVRYLRRTRVSRLCQLV